MLARGFPDMLLQLGQRQIVLLLQRSPQKLSDFLRHPALPTMALLDLAFHLSAALVLCRYFQRVRVAHPKQLSQFPQASIPATVRFQQLPPQIVRICSPHPCCIAETSPEIIYTYGLNALNIPVRKQIGWPQGASRLSCMRCHSK